MAEYSYKPVVRIVAILLAWALVLGGVVYAAGRAHDEQPQDRTVSAIRLQLRDRDQLRDGSCVAAIRQRDRDCDQLGKQHGPARRTRTRASA